MGDSLTFPKRFLSNKKGVYFDALTTFRLAYRYQIFSLSIFDLMSNTGHRDNIPRVLLVRLQFVLQAADKLVQILLNPLTGQLHVLGYSHISLHLIKPSQFGNPIGLRLYSVNIVSHDCEALQV